MKVIPAIDLMDGTAVRLSGGDFSTRKSYASDPAAVARMFEDGGLSSLHVVDLDAARGKGSNIGTLERIASAVSMTIDFGGGIRTAEDIRRVLDAGAKYVNVGSVASKNPEEVVRWGSLFPGRIILSADARNGMVAVSGWMEDTGKELIPFIEYFHQNGINTATVTDISKDGMLTGPSFGLYNRIMDDLPSLSLIASGGVSSADDLFRLAQNGLYGAIVGKAYYEGRITIAEMKEAECSQKG